MQPNIGRAFAAVRPPARRTVLGRETGRSGSGPPTMGWPPCRPCACLGGTCWGDARPGPALCVAGASRVHGGRRARVADHTDWHRLHSQLGQSTPSAPRPAPRPFTPRSPARCTLAHQSRARPSPPLTGSRRPTPKQRPALWDLAAAGPPARCGAASQHWRRTGGGCAGRGGLTDGDLLAPSFPRPPALSLAADLAQSDRADPRGGLLAA